MISRRCAVLALLAGVACNASGTPKGTTTVVAPPTSTETRAPESPDPTKPPPTPSNTAPDFGVEPTDSAPARCNELGAQFEKIVPNVVVLVDRSKSMFEANGQPVRAQLWDPLADALTNASDGVIPQLESEVRFGFVAYNRDANQAVAACPNLQSVPLGLDNGAAIATAYTAAGLVPDNYYKWDTPTAESVQAVTAQLMAFPETGPRYILLVTDGNPDRCGEADPQCGQDDAIAAVQAAFAAGITTYVVGIGEVATATNDSNVSGCWGRCGALHLQDLANAGIGLPVIRNTDPAYLSNCFNGARRDANGQQVYVASYVDDPLAAGVAPFFAPTGRTALREAISSILSGVRSCTFTLTQQVRAGKEGTGNVLLDGAPLVYGDANGWLLSNGTDVQLQGAACTQLQNDVENVEIFFPCESYIR
jgi:hypothetical protein